MYERKSELWQFYENHLNRPGGAPVDMSKKKPGNHIDMSYMYERWEEPAKRPLNECIKFLERIGKKNPASYFKDKIDECKQNDLLLNAPLRECLGYMHTRMFPNEQFKKDCVDILLGEDPATHLEKCYITKCYSLTANQGK